MLFMLWYNHQNILEKITMVLSKLELEYNIDKQWIQLQICKWSVAPQNSDLCRVSSKRC